MKTNKKICFLTSVHSVFDIRIFHKEAKTLVGADYDLTLIAQHTKDEVVDGIKIVALPKPKNRLERFFKTDFLLFKKAFHQKANIYHFHDPELILFALALKLFTGAKIIYDVHEDVLLDILSKDWIHMIIRKLVAISFDRFEKLASRKFDYIITVGDYVKENFKKINPNTGTVKNFPFLDNFKIEKTNNIFNIIYVGGLTPERGISQIIKAMEYLPDNAKLMLLGNFSSKSYEEKIKKLKGFKKVEYFGWVPYQDIPCYLSKANIGLICLTPQSSYLMAAEPTKLFEYMVAELPVVASNFPSWENIIKGSDCGILVDPLDPQSIARAIDWLFKHPKEAKKMGENGRTAVLEKYNWKNEGDKLLNIYKKLCAE